MHGAMKLDPPGYRIKMIIGMGVYVDMNFALLMFFLGFGLYLFIAE